MQALRCSLAAATEAAVLRTMLPRPHAAGGSGPVAALANSCFSPGGALGQISVRCAPLEQRRVCPVALQRCTVPNAW